MNKAIALLLGLGIAMSLTAKNKILNQNVKSLQVVVNQNWLASPAIMTLNSNDVLHVDFDELSHNYHRYTYRLEHCEANWTASEEIFESDWLEGFNDLPIEDYENSINTVVQYTHYQLQIPNDRCRLKMSGNYRLHIIDEDGEEAACAEFMVKEDLMSIGLDITTNTDISYNTSHQQVSMTLNYNGLHVTDPEEQLQTVVMQNGREDNCKLNPKPNYKTGQGLKWLHNRELIFEAGNEYRKFEVLDVTHPTMGIDRISWDGQNYQAHPFVCEPRRNYLYDEDANGAFYIRNSDNRENNTISEYVYVHYQLGPAMPYEQADLIVDGQWTTEDWHHYVMDYDAATATYHATILQKQGYYSFQFLMRDKDGTTHPVPEEGSFYQTENRYQALVYYKGTGERTWRLVGCQRTDFR